MTAMQNSEAAEGAFPPEGQVWGNTIPQSWVASSLKLLSKCKKWDKAGKTKFETKHRTFLGRKEFTAL